MIHEIGWIIGYITYSKWTLCHMSCMIMFLHLMRLVIIMYLFQFLLSLDCNCDFFSFLHSIHFRKYSIHVLYMLWNAVFNAYKHLIYSDKLLDLFKKCRKPQGSLKNNRVASFKHLLQNRYLIQYHDKLIIR